MPRFERNALLQKFKDMKSRGEPIIGGGAGTGLSAKCEERGGIDLIVIYNSGRFRMAGQGSLAGMMPYGDANAIMLDMAREAVTIITAPVSFIVEPKAPDIGSDKLSAKPPGAVNLATDAPILAELLLLLLSLGACA